MKYPEFREAFKDAHWYTGHLCERVGKFYKLMKRELYVMSYDELTELEKKAVEDAILKEEKEKKCLSQYLNELLPAKNKVITFVRANGEMEDRSNISESEYWRVKKDGVSYKVRISGHVYPTGSMTKYSLNIFDTTDVDCRKFCEILGI